MAQLNNRGLSGITFASFQDKLFQLKYKEDDGGQIEGYGSVFNVIDEGGDIVAQGAYANVIDQFLLTGFTGESHNWDFGASIGYPISAYEDDYGLYIVRQFYDTPDAQNIRKKVSQRLKANKAVGLSVGFTAAKVLTIYRANYAAELPKYIRPELLESQLLKAQSFPMIRVIQEVKHLFEDSIVCSPMNRMALASKVKSHPYFADIEDEVEPAVATEEEVKEESIPAVIPEPVAQVEITPTTPPTTVKANPVENPTVAVAPLDGGESSTKDTTVIPLTVQPEFKGAMFGDYIGESLTFGTISRLTDIMLWSLMYESVYARSLSKADKLEMLGQIIAEYAQHVMNISASLLPEDGDAKSLSEEAQQERKQIEAGVVNPFLTKARDFLKAGSPLAGLTFQEHSQLTLAVSKEYSNRLADIVLTRLKEGRKISTATLNRMRSWHDALVEMTNDLSDLIEEVDPDTEKGVAPIGISPVVVAPKEQVGPEEEGDNAPPPDQAESKSEPSEPVLEQETTPDAAQQTLEQLRIKALQQRALIARDALRQREVGV